jgi:hypothetical protein
MFEPAACCRLRVMAVPTVGCDALLELQALLQTARRPDSGGVLQAQHRSWLTAGGADATIREPTTTLATHALSSPTPAASFQTLSPEIQAKTIRLLAQLLRVHIDQGLASGLAQEASDE